MSTTPNWFGREGPAGGARSQGGARHAEDESGAASRSRPRIPTILSLSFRSEVIVRVAKSLVCGVGALSVGFVVSIAAQGPRPQDSDVLPALLTEVRGLRAAIEQMASAGPRVQLALGRRPLPGP